MYSIFIFSAVVNLVSSFRLSLDPPIVALGILICHALLRSLSAYSRQLGVRRGQDVHETSATAYVADSTFR